MQEEVENETLLEDAEQEDESSHYTHPITSFPGYEHIDSYSTIMIGLDRSDDVPVITERSQIYLENDENYLGNDKRLIIRLTDTGEHIGGLSKNDSNALFPLVSSSDVLVDMHLLSGVVNFFVKVQLDVFCREDGNPNYDNTLVSILRTICTLRIEAEVKRNKRKQTEAVLANVEREPKKVAKFQRS